MFFNESRLLDNTSDGSTFGTADSCMYLYKKTGLLFHNFM